MNTRSTEIQIRQSNDAINLPTERRYPLDLMRRRAEVYDRYLESNSRMWDIDGAVRWDALDPSRIDAGARASGRVWSWQSWVAFRDIMTCEAALVRACLEPDISADLKFCIATRASERAAAADAGAELAGRLGHYFERPDSPELEALFDTDMVRRMLHEGVDLDALVVAHFAVVPSIDLAVAEARRAATTEDTVADLLGHVIDDLRRQHEWAWTYLSGRLPERDADTRRAIGANLAEVFEHDLLNGARWTSLIDDVLPGAGALAAAESTAATHGLGGVAAAAQSRAVHLAISDIADRLAASGVPTAAFDAVVDGHSH